MIKVTIFTCSSLSSYADVAL